MISRDNPVENMKKIRSMMRPEIISEMSKQAAKRFKEVVDYASEQEEIRKFLERLV
jgi:hypothetical protein